MTTFVIFRLNDVAFEVANSPDRVNAALARIVTALQLTVLDHFTRLFPGYGITKVVVLAESHAAIHTEPENGLVEGTIQTCGKFDEASLASVLGALRVEFNPRAIYYDVIWSPDLRNKWTPA